MFYICVAHHWTNNPAWQFRRSVVVSAQSLLFELSQYCADTAHKKKGYDTLEGASQMWDCRKTPSLASICTQDKTLALMNVARSLSPGFLMLVEDERQQQWLPWSTIETAHRLRRNNQCRCWRGVIFEHDEHGVATVYGSNILQKWVGRSLLFTITEKAHLGLVSRLRMDIL